MKIITLGTYLGTYQSTYLYDKNYSKINQNFQTQLLCCNTQRDDKKIWLAGETAAQDSRQGKRESGNKGCTINYELGIGFRVQGAGFRVQGLGFREQIRIR